MQAVAAVSRESRGVGTPRSMEFVLFLLAEGGSSSLLGCAAASGWTESGSWSWDEEAGSVFSQSSASALRFLDWMGLMESGRW